jgi:hypothetical protein
MDYWFNLAYDVKTYGGVDGPEKFYKSFALREFGTTLQDDVAKILHTYLQINNIRTPEIVLYNTFNVIKYDEATRLLGKYTAISERAQKIYDNEIESDRKKAFYHLVLYPVRASCNVYKLMIYLGLNKEYTIQGRFIANWYGSEAKTALDQDNKEMDYINKELDGGKWNGYGNEYHIGQITWNPRTSQFSFAGDFALSSVNNVEGTEMIVIPQYESGVSAGKKNGTVTLPRFHSFVKETHYVDVGNSKNGSFTFTTTTSGSWIKLNETSGNVSAESEARIEVSLDWDNMPSDENGRINITGNGVTVTVIILIDRFDAGVTIPAKTYIETDGYISILSKNFVNSIPSLDGAKWEIIPNYGREESSVKVQPSQIDIHRTPGTDSPYLEYNVYIRTAGDIDIVTQWAPTSGPVPDTLTRLRYGISLNKDDIKIVHTLPPDFIIIGKGWDSWAAGEEYAVRTATVRDGNICYSKHSVSSVGLYKVRIYMVDDGLILQKILVGTKVLERADTEKRTAKVKVDPDTREIRNTEVSIDIPSVSIPRIFIGSKQNPTAGCYDSYFGPPETYYTK